MRTPYQMVKEFHQKFGLPIAEKPTRRFPDKALRDLRVELIREEFEEFVSAATGRKCLVLVEIPPSPSSTDLNQKASIVGMADALADMMYVVAGAAVAYGVPLDEVMEEVHRSNMAKLGSNGKPILREDGKILKPEGWEPPDVDGVLRGELEEKLPDTACEGQSSIFEHL